jgi:TolA-binding protein
MDRQPAGLRRVVVAKCRSLVCLLALLASVACAHVSAPEDRSPKSDKELEVAVLRERVGRLERKLSDLDAQMKLVSERIAHDGGPRQQVSLGAPDPYAAARGSYEGRPAAPAYEGSHGAPASSWQGVAGLRSIDLGTLPGPAGYAEDLAAEDRSDVEESDDLSYVTRARVASAPAPRSAPAGPVGGTAGSRPDVQTQYDWAHARMEEGRYPEAAAGFEAILATAPTHKLADNALYWVGVCHLQRGEPRLAIDTWKKLPLRFPSSAKMPDSLFGMATAHEELGEPVIAETLYIQFVQQFPKAEKVSEAKKAIKRLSGSPDAPR